MGAAGNVGSKVADTLLQGREEVRVLQHARDLGGLRERGADVVTGDAMNVEDLLGFFDGSVAALVLLPENVADPAFVENRRTISRAIAEALAKAGVPHIVALSTVGAALPDAPGPPGGLYAFERDLDELDANVLVLRSAAYMDYLLAAVPMIQAQKVNGSAIRPDVTFPMVATQDVAREAADRLVRRDFSGHQVKLLLGPEDVSMEMATRLIGARLGIPELPYVEFPPEGVRGALMGAGMSEQVAGLLVDMQLAVNDGRYDSGVRRTAESTTPTRLADFLRQALPAGLDTMDGEGAR
jgi:uncharacterized protein YbjT (DUF2867 family)